VIANFAPSEVYSIEVTGDTLTHIVLLLSAGRQVPCRADCEDCCRASKAIKTARYVRSEEARCLCDFAGPDEFGNYDLMEHPGCPIHGDPA
jgi:hypothetical protein